MSTDDISFLLGYQELNSFLRAFSSWTGISVSEYKKYCFVQNTASKPFYKFKKSGSLHRRKITVMRLFQRTQPQWTAIPIRCLKVQERNFWNMRKKCSKIPRSRQMLLRKMLTRKTRSLPCLPVQEIRQPVL